MSDVNEAVKNLKTTIEQDIDKKMESINAKIADASPEKIKEIVSQESTELKNALEAHLGTLTKEQQKQMDNLEVEFKKYKQQGASAGHSLGRTFTKALKDELSKDELKAKLEGYAQNQSKGFDFNMKAVGNMSITGNLTGDVIEPDRIAGIKVAVERKKRIRELLSGGTMSADKITFVRESGGEGTTSTVAENGNKPQTDYDFTNVESPARKIANHVRVSEELLTDMDALVGFLGLRMPQKIKLVEDTQLLYGDGNAPNLTGLTINASAGTGSGMSVASPQKWDAMIATMSQLSQTEYSASAFVMNDQDFYEMLLVKDTQNRYVAPFLWEGGLASLFGVPIITNNTVDAGHLLCGDFQMGAQLFDRQGVNIRFYDQDQDNAIKNMVTVVAEERLALPIYYDGAFVYDSFADIITDITAA
jgi:HK97 family phage major capsid protein